jgi:NitT/TauT family transport system substrate-binding protein
MKPTALALIAMLALAIPANAGADDVKTVPSSAPVSIVASYGGADVVYAPVWVAERAGIFRKHGLNVDMQYQASSVQIPSVISGDVKLALVGCTAVAAANASGADLVVLANLAPIQPYLLMVPASIKKPSDLTGKVIGISKFGDTTDAVSRLALQKLGIKPDSVTFVQVGSAANRVAALLGGTIQAGVMQPPLSFDLQKQGYHTLFDVSRLRIPAALTLTGQRKWVEANRDTVQRYVDALLEAIAREKRDKPFAIGVLKDYMKVDNEQALSDAYDYYTQAVLPTVPHMLSNQCDFALEALAVSNEKLRHYDFAAVIDDRFVTTAAKGNRR